MRKVKRSTSFCKQKEAKKLFDSGAEAVEAPTPMAQIKRSLFVSFSSERELLPALAF
jgi:hypothetical protein